MSYGLEDYGSIFDKGREFLPCRRIQTGSGPTKPPTKWVPGASSRAIKRLGRETAHSPPSSAEVKNSWSYTSIPPYVFVAWYSVKHRNSFFTFAFISHNSLLPFAFPTNISYIRRCIQKFPDWPPGERTANGTALCH